MLNNMVVRNISEAKAQLSALIAMVEHGDEVILSRAGKPVAKMARTCVHSIGAAGAAPIGLEAPSEV